MKNNTLIPSLYNTWRTRTRPVQYKVEGDCWICTSHLPSVAGYPRIQISGQKFSLPRLVCLLFNGPGKENEYVLHSCDNKMCINPEHLRMGTYSENNKRPSPRKLSRGDKEFIKWMDHCGINKREIAIIFGIPVVTIYYHLNKNRWKRNGK
jgi:hypothetical protein